MRLSISKKIMCLIMLTILIVSGSITLAAYYYLDDNFNAMSEKELSYNADVVTRYWGNLKDKVMTITKMTAFRPDVQRAIAQKDIPFLRKLSLELQETTGIDYVTFVDNAGTVLSRSHSEINGDSLGNILNVKKALAGESLVTLDEGKIIKFSMRAATPIISNGSIVGAVTAGINLSSSNNFVDEVKKDLEAECTLFRGDTRVSTTLIRDGKRAIGTKMDNPKVIEAVIQKGKIYLHFNKILGKDYNTVYWPLRNAENKVMGMLFLGRERADINKAYMDILWSIVSVVLVVGIIMTAMAVFLSRTLTKPLNRMVEVSRKIALGDLTQRLDIKQKDEIGALAETFNDMVKNLNKVTVSKDYVDNIIKSMINTLIVVSPDNKIISANAAACQLLGYEETELIGRPAEVIFSGDRSRQDGWMGNMLADCQIANIEEVYRTKDGREVPVLFSASVMQDDNPLQSGIVYVAQDITKRKEAEEALRQSNEQLQQAQKMEAVGKLAGGIAHDFNNILTAISGQSELLLMDLSQNDPRRQGVKEIQRAAERAASLTRQLLAFSRKQIIKPQVVDLNALVGRLDGMLRRLINEDIQIISRLAPDLGTIFADTGQIEQAVVNLVVNGRDAMPNGGKIIIETAEVELDKNHFQQYPMFQPGPYVMLAVSDTGLGMDSETQARIFEPFFTTKGIGEGTGLGLSMVYGIVRQNSGYIWVESEHSQGTTFKIYFPRIMKAIEAVEPPQVLASSLNGSETILLAEDEDMVREIAKRMLEKEGYLVIEANSGTEALRIGVQYKESIHLILSDVLMPDINGPEFVSRLQPQHPEAKVLYMSGHTENAIVNHGVLHNGIAFIQKPFKMEHFLRKVREVLDLSA